MRNLIVVTFMSLVGFYKGPGKESVSAASPARGAVRLRGSTLAAVASHSGSAVMLHLGF